MGEISCSVSVSRKPQRLALKSFEEMPLQVCRICLQRGSDYVPLDSGKDSYRLKLLICVPEINVDIIKNPVLCDECAIKLNEAYKFRCTCIESEKKIAENLTLLVNLENTDIRFEINNILLSNESMNEHWLSDDAVNNLNIEIKQKSFAEDVENKRHRESCENFASDLKKIKQEPDVKNDNENDNDVEEDNKEFLALSLNNATIKEEPDFFYSEYDIDSKENNNVNLTNQEMCDIVSKILMEHSYFSHFDINVMETTNSNKTNKDEDCSNADNNVTCEICKELCDAQLISAHIEMHKNIKIVRLPEEGYLSVKVNTERKFMCRYCNKIFNECALLYDHINMTHKNELIKENTSKEVLCKICNTLFDEKIIKRHLELHKADKLEVNANSASRIKLICKICGDIFAEEKLFMMHYRTHKQSQATITCTVCGETYDQTSAKVHMEFHNIVQEIVLDSDVEEAAFSSSLEINNQVEAGTSGLKTSNYTCCNEEFSNLYLLHLHTTKVHGYVCYVCNIKFPNKQALGGHFRVHNEQKSHQCKDCGKHFAQRGNLLRHTHFVHNCVMPYKCDKCGQRFRRNKYLEEHMRSHTQRYVCTECDRVFTELKLLRRHKRFHMPRPHQCDLCDTVFTAKSSLVRHKRDIHKVKVTGRRSYGLGDIVLGSTETSQ